MKTTQQLLKENNIRVEIADNVWGYRVYQNDKERNLFMLITQRFKNGSFKAYPATSLMILLEDGKKVQKIETLHKLVYVYFKGNTGDLVIDHIDNDPTNNSIDNLQLVTRSDNTKKDAAHHNQYTPQDQRRHVKNKF